MKGQISRDSFRRGKRYSGVYQTQGAMVTDADLGEEQRITKNQIDKLGKSTVEDGVPAQKGAVEIGAGDVPELRPGVIYADGVRGFLTAADPGDLDGPLDIFTNQADLPQGPELPTGHQVIYADIWERPVFALEDEYLADAGLHGAETAFRTRTMTQLKAIQTAVADPEALMTAEEVEAIIADLPQKGTGQLSIDVPDPETHIDDCDPCANVVTEQSEVPNALWRLEVIRVEGPAGNPTRVALAWSIENGAVIAPADVDHNAFESGDKVYEFYSAITESHRGVFDDPGDACRPAFVDDLAATPSPANDHNGDPWPFVRRWDGYAEFNLQTGSMTRDIGEGPEPTISGRQIQLSLNSFTATLDLDGAAIVAGDYWLVELRSFAAEGERVRLVKSAPVGIQHHYCTLFAVNDGAALALTDSQERKLSFPVLSDLPATHVGFENNCTKLYNEAENVQEALDELCEISAEDIAFDPDTCPRLYNRADNVQDALANLCNVDFSTERLLRLLHDWGVLCGIVPRVSKGNKRVVIISGGSFLDRAGRIGTFEGGAFDLNDVPQERIHFANLDALRRALRRGEACLALAANRDGEVNVHLAAKGQAFGPADPTYRQRVKTCVEGKKPIAIGDRLKTLTLEESAVAEKVFLVANKRGSFEGSAKLTRGEAVNAAAFNNLMLEEYKASASAREFRQVEEEWQAIAADVRVDNARGETREVRRMQLHSRQLGALLQNDQTRVLRCLCDMLFPSCPPEPGDPPYLVPIACLTGSFDVEILIDEVCPFCCRKQAMTWRSVQYFLGDWRDNFAGKLAKYCCHPKEEDEPERPGPSKDFTWRPDVYENLDFKRFADRFELRESFLGEGPATPSDYQLKVPVEDLSPSEAKRALAGNGVEVVDEIEVGDRQAFDRILEKSVQLEATDRLADDGKVKPGDKVALLTRDGVAVDYVAVERGSKYLYDKPPAPVDKKDLERPTITPEEARRLRELVVSAETARGSLDELESRRESLSGGVTGLEGEIDDLESQRKETLEAVAEARRDLRRLNESQASVRRELDSAREQAGRAQADAERAQTDAERASVQAERARTELEATRGRIESARGDLETATASLEAARTEMASAEGQREAIIGSLRANQPALSVAGDRRLAASLAEEGIHFVGDIVEMSSAKSADLVRRRVLSRAQVTNLQRDAKAFVAVRG